MKIRVGKHTITIDDMDWDLFFVTWHVCGNYAGYRPTILGKRIPILSMHRTVMERKLGRRLEKWELVDHVNGNGLDNRRENLRVATAAQNQWNRGKSKRSKSGYKGIFFQNGRWVSRLMIGGKNTVLGSYKSKMEAIRVYDEAARLHHGEFARLNFTEGIVDGEDGSVGTSS